MARRSVRGDSGRGGLVAAVAVTALAAGALTFALGSVRNPSSGGIQGAMSDAGGAIGGVFSVPLRWIDGIGDTVGSFFADAEELRRLRAENAALMQWRDQALTLAERLEAYERLYGIRGDGIGQGVATRIVSETGGPFARTGIIGAGREQGVGVNWIVFDSRGLVGRVIAVGAHTSRVLLLTDGDSRVPVMGETTRARAILQGDKTAAPLLSHLNLPPVIREDERLLTSGDDGLFPRGIAVGVAATGPDGRTRVRLASDRAPLDFVRVVPPTSFPAPPDPVTLPEFAPPPAAPLPAITAGAILPGVPGAAGVPAAATPEAIRAAQQAQDEARATREALRQAEAERDALRRQQQQEAARRGTGAAQTGQPPAAARPGGGQPVTVELGAGPAAPAASPPPPAPPPPPPPPSGGGEAAAPPGGR